MAKLIIIPARKGSKGIPGKNTRKLGDKPLIAYSFEFAYKVAEESDVICVSTNDELVIDLAKAYCLKTPFIRPEYLANDTVASYDVIMHALSYYEKKGYTFLNVLLLQPTSPFRHLSDYISMVDRYTNDIDMVVTVKESKDNPYFNLFEEGPDGVLELSKNKGTIERRQDAPLVYAYNGSMYLMNVKSLKQKRIQNFTRIRKVVQPEERSIDIDIYPDWVLAEYFLETFKQSEIDEKF
jgi:CMP-N,N'-diacetyllegionaminic acid synthase